MTWGTCAHENPTYLRLVRLLGRAVLGYWQEAAVRIPGADARLTN